MADFVVASKLMSAAGTTRFIVTFSEHLAPQERVASLTSQIAQYGFLKSTTARRSKSS